MLVFDEIIYNVTLNSNVFVVHQKRGSFQDMGMRLTNPALPLLPKKGSHILLQPLRGKAFFIG